MDDLISRQAVLDYIDHMPSELTADGRRMIRRRILEEYISDTLPPVTPQPKAGHWIRWYEQKEHDWGIEHIPHCRCSECGKEYDPHSSQFIKFCNECGAKMVESQERSE